MKNLTDTVKWLYSNFKEGSQWKKAAMVAFPIDFATQIAQNIISTDNAILNSALDSGGSFFPVIFGSYVLYRWGSIGKYTSVASFVSLIVLGEMAQKFGLYLGVCDSKDIYAALLAGGIASLLAFKEKKYVRFNENKSLNTRFS